MSCYLQPNPLPSPFRLSPSSSALVSTTTLPSSFDWRNVSGLDLTSPIRSQYVPQWCGSCWAHAVTSALADRVNGMNARAPGAREGSQPARRGSAMLAVQNLLDCAGTAGTCNGGSWELSFEFARKTGITDDSCSPYLGSDRNCLGGARMCTLCYSDGTCVPVPGARKFRVEEWDYMNASSYGSKVSSAPAIAAMQEEILQRGPIVCSMQTEDDDNAHPWHCYEGGVYRTNSTFASTNHVINLLGWGTAEDGVDFWIGRHSGGTIFGEDGFFRIERGVNALNIESHCGWATIADARPTRSRNMSQLPCENGVPRPPAAAE